MAKINDNTDNKNEDLNGVPQLDGNGRPLAEGDVDKGVDRGTDPQASDILEWVDDRIPLVYHNLVPDYATVPIKRVACNVDVPAIMVFAYYADEISKLTEFYPDAPFSIQDGTAGVNVGVKRYHLLACNTVVDELGNRIVSFAYCSTWDGITKTSPTSFFLLIDDDETQQLSSVVAVDETLVPAVSDRKVVDNRLVLRDFKEQLCRVTAVAYIELDVTSLDTQTIQPDVVKTATFGSNTTKPTVLDSDNTASRRDDRNEGQGKGMDGAHKGGTLFQKVLDQRKK